MLSSPGAYYERIRGHNPYFQPDKPLECLTPALQARLPGIDQNVVAHADSHTLVEVKALAPGSKG